MVGDDSISYFFDISFTVSLSLCQSIGRLSHDNGRGIDFWFGNNRWVPILSSPVYAFLSL